MPRIYIACFEEEMVRKHLGLSVLSKYVKPGNLLLLSLCITQISGVIHLRIYSELDTLLLDILASTSAKVILACPRSPEHPKYPGSTLNGEEWLEALAGKSSNVPRVSLTLEESQKWHPVYWEQWMSWLTQELSNTGKPDISLSQYAHIRGWNEYLKSVVEVCPPQHTEVECQKLYNLFWDTEHYCKDILLKD